MHVLNHTLQGVVFQYPRNTHPPHSHAITAVIAYVVEIDFLGRDIN
jgi:hypothetical protein